MSLTPEQIEFRRDAIGGSEIAAVVGEHAFLSSFDLYAIKTGAYVVPQNDDMQRGTFLEPGVLAWYLERTGSAQSVGTGSVRHSTFSRAIATPDALVFPGFSTESPRRLLEIKCPRGSDGWGPDGSDEIPPGYLLQVQWTHAVLSSLVPVDSEIHVAALIWGDLRIYKIQADPELQSYLFLAAQNWWTTHIDGKTPPELDGGPGAHSWLKSKFKQTKQLREATAREELLMLGLRDAEAQAAEAEEQLATAKQLVCASIGEAEGITGPVGSVTWRENKNGVRAVRTKWSEESK